MKVTSHPLGFRALKRKGDIYVSGQRQTFIWDDSNIGVAECTKYNENPIVHGVIPGRHCTCGIYAGLIPKIAHGYQYGSKTLVTLNKAGGEVILFEKGWRAEEAKIVAIVNSHKRGKIELDDEEVLLRDYHAELFMASEYFQVPIFDEATAIAMVKSVWTKQYQEEWCW